MLLLRREVANGETLLVTRLEGFLPSLSQRPSFGTPSPISTGSLGSWGSVPPNVYPFGQLRALLNRIASLDLPICL